MIINCIFKKLLIICTQIVKQLYLADKRVQGYWRGVAFSVNSVLLRPPASAKKGRYTESLSSPRRARQPPPPRPRLLLRPRDGFRRAEGSVPAREPYETGRLKVSDVHTIYYEQSGNPGGHVSAPCRADDQPAFSPLPAPMPSPSH